MPLLEVVGAFDLRVAGEAFRRVPVEDQHILGHLRFARVEQVAEKPPPRRSRPIGDRDAEHAAARAARHAHRRSLQSFVLVSIERKDPHPLHRRARPWQFARRECIRHGFTRGIEDAHVAQIPACRAAIGLGWQCKAVMRGTRLGADRSRIVEIARSLLSEGWQRQRQSDEAECFHAARADTRGGTGDR